MVCFAGYFLNVRYVKTNWLPGVNILDRKHAIMAVSRATH